MEKNTEKLSEDQMKTLSDIICLYYRNEFEMDETEALEHLRSSDPSDIGIAFTTLTDREIPIQVSLDLIKMQLVTKIGNYQEDGSFHGFIKKKSVSFKELVSEYFFDFDILTGWSDFVEEHIGEFD